MKIQIDTELRQVIRLDNGAEVKIPLYSPEAFDLISDVWLKVEWSQRYSYTFTWLGRPLIQLPADVLRIQEVIYKVKPTLIIETGIAHGGSLVFYASLFKMLGFGRVVGVDIEIRPHNRKAIESHEMSPLITLVEGSSTAPETVDKVCSLVKPEDKVLVILDSCHTKSHVAAELEAYCELVSPGSYIVATDGCMKDLHDVPGGRPEWELDHPTAAAAEFAGKHPEFILGDPAWVFNESKLNKNLTHWPGAYLLRK